MNIIIQLLYILMEDFKKMRKAGKLSIQVLDFITPYVKEGVTTNELDKLCHDFIFQKMLYLHL